jgi:hypothetical protein
LRIADYKGNDAWLTIPITGKKNNNIKPKEKKTTNHFVYANRITNLENKNVSVYIPKDTFYDDFFIDFNVANDTLTLHNALIPAKKSVTINFNISNYTKEDKDKLFIARMTGYKDRFVYSSTTKKGNIISTRTKNLGTYTLASDIENPKIKPINFQENKWLSKYRYLKVKLSDNLSGIKNYRATINNKWILMEYDAKKGQLVYDFNDNVITETKNNLKIIVTDNVGNSTTFETIFFRK